MFYFKIHHISKGQFEIKSILLLKNQNLIHVNLHYLKVI
jgi:hypothetical protein